MRARLLTTVVALAGLATSGCGAFGGEGDFAPGSVLTMKPGECYQAPEEVKAQVSRLEPLSCDEPHDYEVYAVTDYSPADPELDPDVFPGDEALEAFADGRCAQEFETYVGLSYLDSPDLFFTYLTPSPRSWEGDDRKVICFAYQPGRQLTGSVEDSGSDDGGGDGDPGDDSSDDAPG